MDKTNITSLNVRGINDSKKRRIIFRWLSNGNNKIVFLQETFLKNELNKMEMTGWDGKMYNSLSNSTHSKGVAILLHNSLEYKIKNIHRKDDGRVLIINGEIEGNETTLCSVYAPTQTKQRLEFFKNARNWILRHSDNENNIIMGGDFNCGLNENDRTNVRHSDNTRKDFRKLINDIELTDAWYAKNDIPQYTFEDPVSKSKSRLDYIFISAENFHKVKQIKLKYAPTNDRHLAVCMTINLKQNKRGPGYWKMNAKLLDLPEFDSLVLNVRNDCMNNYKELDHRTRWELFKIKICEASIRFGIARAKRQRIYIKKLQDKIDVLNENESKGILIDKNEKNKLESKIKEYYSEKDDGYMLRSKYKWVNEGEKSTSYFFNLEKTRQSGNTIKRIRDVNGNLKTSDEDILNAGTGFYTDLYKSKNISQEDIINYLNSVDIETKVSESQKLTCDSEITEKEIENVIQNLKNGKSPGCDGLTTEFYKKYWKYIKEMFLAMVKETYEKGEMAYTMRKALLSLLYKKGDETLLKNYRPISLTNYDYKIICFVLANRLQKVLKDIIHPDQTGYIKNRYIGCNARLIQDYFEHCENFQIPGILLFLDFEKAFDSIEWEYMFEVLKKFGFGEGFIKWVRVLYTKPIMSIKNNGWHSCDISLNRGVRQGCPLSALLFVISVEIMAIKIRKNRDISGFKMLELEVKTSMYADDTSLLLSDLKSMENAIDEVNTFSRIAGPRLNVDKTEGILLGPLKDSIMSHKDIAFTNEAIRCLGIYIGHDKNKCEENNWNKKLEKMDVILERWKNRNLTIFGKILIIKSLAASILVHPMSILSTPLDFLQKVEKMFFKFLWNSTERIKRKTLIGSKMEGGVDMLDIISKNKALKSGWMKRIHSKNANSGFVNLLLDKYRMNIEQLIKCNMTDVNEMKNILKLPMFWCEVFCYANECKTLKDLKCLSTYEFLSEPIWLNTRFLHKGKPIFLANWIKSGIFYVKDVFDQNGLFITEQSLKNKLNNTQNWIAEYMKVKRILKKELKDIDTSLSHYINVKTNWTIVHNNSIFSLKTQKSSFYYQILIEKKFIRNYMENKWSKDFNLERSHWNKIYKNIFKIVDKKLGEFKYKLICNILSTRANVSHWNKKISDKCQYCNDKQTVKHMLYECPRVLNLWTLIGSILKVDIKFKHIVIGNIEESEYIQARNLSFSYIAYAIYKFWVMSENSKINFRRDCLITFVKNDLFRRTFFIKNKRFSDLCDSIITSM